MTEPSFFEFGSQPGDFDHVEHGPWLHRFRNLGQSTNEGIVEATFDEEALPTHGEIIELIETLHAGESSPFAPKELSNRPYAIHLPVHYEARYAYPLVIWFHGDGSSEQEISAVMPEISDRNFIGLALRGNVVQESGFAWTSGGEQSDALLNDIESIVRFVRRKYHVHSERIYLAGFGSGASVAMELILRKPEWFGGAACLCGKFQDLQVPSLRDSELRNKRVLLATSAANRSSAVGDVVSTGRLLYASGMQIGTRVYQESGTTPSKKMLSDVNSWLMDDVCSVSH